MKVASGTYVNIYSEIGYDNLMENIDIYVIFPEYLSASEIDLDEVQGVVENVVANCKANGTVTHDDIKKQLEESLDDYEIVETFIKMI